MMRPVLNWYGTRFVSYFRVVLNVNLFRMQLTFASIEFAFKTEIYGTKGNNIAQKPSILNFIVM